MPEPVPGPFPGGEQSPVNGHGPRLAWWPGSTPITGPAVTPRPWPDGGGLAGPLPSASPPAGGSPGAGVPSDGGRPALDGQALLEGLAAGGFLAGDAGEQDGLLAEELAAEADGRMGPPLPLGHVAALTVEHMPPGPAMAAWLDAAVRESATLDEYALAGTVIAARKLSSWATGAELASVAQITARAAAADPSIGLAADGRPARMSRDAVGQVSLALRATDYAAMAWADLAVVLCWRLPATGAALACGQIDLARARVIADVTSVLPVAAARVVEEQILPGAGTLTTAQLRERLRYRVIAADP